MLEDQAATLRALKVKKPQPPKPEGAPAEGDEPLPEPEYDEEEERFVLVVVGRNGAWVDGVWSGAGSRVALGDR